MDLEKLRSRLETLAGIREAMRPFAEDAPPGYEQMLERLRAEAAGLIAAGARESLSPDEWFVVSGTDARHFGDVEDATAMIAGRVHGDECRRIVAHVREQPRGEAVSYPGGRNHPPVIVLRLPGGSLRL